MPTATTNHTCTRCNVTITPEYADVAVLIEGVQVGPYCHSCWQNTMICDSCHTGVSTVSPDAIKYYDELSLYMCKSCAETKLKICDGCGSYAVIEVEHPTLGGLCAKCNKTKFTCAHCGVDHLAPLRWNSEGPVKSAQYPGIYRKHKDNLCNVCFNSIKHRFKFVDVYICENCGELTTSSQVTPSTIRHFCSRCVSRSDVFMCSVCKEWHNGAKVFSHDNEDNEIVACSHCMKTRFHCKVCARLLPKSQKVDVLGESMCQTCEKESKQCKVCGEFVKDESIISDGMCTKCKSNSNLYCCKCGKHKMFNVKGNSHPYCRSCDAKEGLGLVLSYSTKPNTILNTLGGKGLIFGFENEMSFKSGTNVSRVTGEILSKFPFSVLYAKSDSSVWNGNEFISHPMTKCFFDKTSWEGLFSHGLCLPAKEVKLAHDHFTGMHVHLAKSCFTTHHMYKYINFLYANTAYVELIGERPLNHYCSNFANYQEVKSSSKTKQTRNRGFINMMGSNKGATMELRFFNGTHTEEMLRKNIEFVCALYQFTLVSSRLDSSNINLFEDFVKKHKYEYRNLCKFLFGDKVKFPTKKS